MPSRSLCAALWLVVYASGAAPATAETSAMTDAFVVATAQAYDALEKSDALAAVISGRVRLQTFARRDDAEQSLASEALAAWGLAAQRQAKLDSQTRSIDGLGSLLYPYDAVVLPFDLHGRTSSDADKAALAQLSQTQGPEFELRYTSLALEKLHVLEAAYVDYVKNGDDPTLRRLSVRNLPRVRQLLADLNRL